MSKKYNKIMVALVGDGTEIEVVENAYHLSNNLKCSLVAIHVNDPHAGDMSMMMDSPRAINHETLQKQLSDYLGNDIADKIDIIITENESIPKSIEQHTLDCDLLIVGHRKMSQFKASLMDSIDEGIANLISCPVLVVQK
tara:strand:+ start:469 stop:888 length:420 start_codon:yes stop_codon:yes gene_type:complete